MKSEQKAKCTTLKKKKYFPCDCLIMTAGNVIYIFKCKLFARLTEFTKDQWTILKRYVYNHKITYQITERSLCLSYIWQWMFMILKSLWIVIEYTAQYLTQQFYFSSEKFLGKQPGSFNMPSDIFLHYFPVNLKYPFSWKEDESCTLVSNMFALILTQNFPLLEAKYLEQYSVCPVEIMLWNC